MNHYQMGYEKRNKPTLETHKPEFMQPILAATDKPARFPGR